MATMANGRVSPGFVEAHIMTTRVYMRLFSISGIDFKIKTVELGGKKIKLQIW